MVWVFPSPPCQWRKCTVEKGAEGSVLRIWVQVLVAKLFKTRIEASHWWNVKQYVLRNYLWWATHYLLRQSDRTDAWTTGFKIQITKNGGSCFLQHRSLSFNTAASNANEPLWNYTSRSNFPSNSNKSFQFLKLLPSFFCLLTLRKCLLKELRLPAQRLCVAMATKLSLAVCAGTLNFGNLTTAVDKDWLTIAENAKWQFRLPIVG